jgi:hypothetical protein
MNVVSISAALSWDSTLAKVREWASRVRREFEEPDYWKGIADLRSPFPFNANAINNDAPLSAFQATKLREGLSSLHIRLVKEFSLNQAQSDLILGKLDHLSKAIEKQSRTDWVNMAIGVLVTIAMTIGVSSANSDKFWGLVRDSLHTAFQIMIGN